MPPMVDPRGLVASLGQQGVPAPSFCRGRQRLPLAMGTTAEAGWPRTESIFYRDKEEIKF